MLTHCYRNVYQAKAFTKYAFIYGIYLLLTLLETLRIQLFNEKSAATYMKTWFLYWNDLMKYNKLRMLY